MIGLYVDFTHRKIEYHEHQIEIVTNDGVQVRLAPASADDILDSLENETPLWTRARPDETHDAVAVSDPDLDVFGDGPVVAGYKMVTVGLCTPSWKR